MRSWTRVAVGATTLLVGVNGLAGRADASCAGPTVEVSPTAAAAGAELHVTGKYWASDCQDTGTVVNGTPSPSSPPPPDRVRVFFVQQGERQLLAKVTADADYNLAVTVGVPQDATPGPATIEAIGDHIGVTIRAPLRVIAVSHPVDVPPAELASTGSHSSRELLVGVAALVAGIVLALTGLRRRPQRSVKQGPLPR